MLVEPVFWLLKLRLAGVTPAMGALPVPLRVTDCVLLEASLVLSVMVKVAVRLPVAAGVKVTLMVQFPLAAMLPPQLLEGLVETAKSPGLVPESATLLTVRAAFPVLLSVTV